MMNFSTTVLGLAFQNPLLSASGKWAWTAEQLQHIVAGGAGGITTKSFSTLERTGHPEPTVVHTEHYTLNAVGLPSRGFDAVYQDLSSFMGHRPVPVIISIFGDTVERFAESVEKFSTLNPDAIELNISCPNVQDDHGRPFSYIPGDAAAVVQAAKNAAPGMKFFAKLSANTPDMVAVALACVEAGCDGLTLINTLGPGMAIDLATRKPVLSNKSGGLSGPALKPIAVRCIADVYKATNGHVPIIGVGGVEDGEDALELMMAGASLVAMGTSVLDQGYDVFKKVEEKMSAWAKKQGITSLQEIVGAIHKA